MSKKSRRRNRKILGALAAGLGAMALRNRGVPAAANVDSGRGSGLRDTVDTPKAYITKKAESPVDTGSDFQTRFTTKVGDKWMGPNEARTHAPVTGVEHPVLGQSRVIPGGMRRFSKGGRVTGIAKRGFGRALMKGKK